MKRSLKFERIYRKGQRLALKEQYDDAIHYFEKVLEKHPNDTNSMYSKALSLIELEEYQKAISCFDKILKLELNAIAVLNKKSECLRVLEKHTQAILCIEKALRINPRHTDSLATKIRILERIHRWDDAKNTYDIFLESWRKKYGKRLKSLKSKKERKNI